MFMCATRWHCLDSVSIQKVDHENQQLILLFPHCTKLILCTWLFAALTVFRGMDAVLQLLYLSLKHLHLLVLSRLIYMKCSNLVSRALWTVEYRPCWLCCSPQLLCPMPGKTLLQTKCCHSRDTVVNNMTFISACQWLQLVSLICISSCGSNFVGRKTWKLLVLVV